MTTINFGTSYQNPGVYIQEQITPLVNVVGLRPNVVGIAGPSVGWRSFSEAQTLTGTVANTLIQLGIIPASVVVKGSDGTVFTPTTDYVLTVGVGADGQIGTTTDNTLSIVRATSGSGIISGSTVYVTYHYTDVNYSRPAHYTDYDDVKQALGEPFDVVSGAVLSPLSLAAKIAFENGAGEVVLAPTADIPSSTPTAPPALTGTQVVNTVVTTRANLNAAMATLSADFTIDLLVPLPVGMTGTPGSVGDIVNVGSDLGSYLVTQENNTLHQIGFLGYENTVTVDPTVIAGTVANHRVVLAFPNRMLYYNSIINQTVEVGGYYLAAALAGSVASRDPEIPLTKKTVLSFSGIPSPVFTLMTTSFKNNYSAKGICVVEITRQGTLGVRHGVTTDPSTTQTR
jgi:hypothetical protein